MPNALFIKEIAESIFNQRVQIAKEAQQFILKTKVYHEFRENSKVQAQLTANQTCLSIIDTLRTNQIELVDFHQTVMDNPVLKENFLRSSYLKPFLQGIDLNAKEFLITTVAQHIYVTNKNLWESSGNNSTKFSGAIFHKLNEYGLTAIDINNTKEASAWFKKSSLLKLFLNALNNVSSSSSSSSTSRPKNIVELTQQIYNERSNAFLFVLAIFQRLEEKVDFSQLYVSIVHNILEDRYHINFTEITNDKDALAIFNLSKQLSLLTSIERNNLCNDPEVLRVINELQRDPSLSLPTLCKIPDEVWQNNPALEQFINQTWGDICSNAKESTVNKELVQESYLQEPSPGSSTGMRFN